MTCVHRPGAGRRITGILPAARTRLPAVAAAGLPAIHLHDLRHAGNTFTANAGANLRELMQRMGHSSTRAALIYLHGGDQRQRTIADSVSDMARRRYTNSPNAGGASLMWHGSGTQRVGGWPPIARLHAGRGAVTWCYGWSRLSESNRRPIHYE